MSERLTLRAYKGMDEERFKSVFERVVLSKGGRIFWDEQDAEFGSDCRMAHNGQVHTIYTQYQDGDWLFYQELGKILDASWAQLDICEGSLWQAIFYQAGKEMDRFSTAPEYWEGAESKQKELDKWKGRPEVVASLWNVPVSRINHYMVNWGYHTVDENTFEYRIRTKGKAYPEDKYQYADIWQMLDFLNALGGFDPTNLKEHGAQHRIELPSRNDLGA